VRRLPDLAAVRAAWWTWRALRVVRRALASGEVRDIALPAPPRLPGRAVRGVERALRRSEPTCLERALVRQRWLAAHGRPVPIAIGVTSPAEGFQAHAWLIGEDDELSGRYHELTRLAP
jgi:hypothetical protein